MSESTTPHSERWPRVRSFVARTRRVIPFVAGVLAAFVALVLYNAATPGPQPLTLRDVNDTVQQVLASATPPPPYAVLVREAIRPSLVLIQTRTAENDTEDEAKVGLDRGLGTGVVVSDRGDILTSLHVVEDAEDIELTFADGTQSPGEIVAAQPENDIAVVRALRLPGVLVPATLGNPGAVRVGDEAYVVGHPLGLYGSMSAGVISGLDRSFQPSDAKTRLEGLIQFDAAVNPGNSGGPLLNRYGQVIGIVAGLINPTEQNVFIGIGFAVPINVAGGAAGMPAY
jgi:S1-C subfamily serine protease